MLVSSRSILRVAVLGACLAGGDAIYAAAPADSASASPVSGPRLEEVVVTARKRAENLQDVPLSISAIEARDLQRLNLSTSEDLARYDASLIFDNGLGAADTRIVVRGLSPTRGRTNVAIVVDGVNVSSESVNFAGGGMLATNRLLDLERVEIVKGPQSALYGRGAFAGAIAYVTKDPAREFEAEAGVDIGDFSRQEASLALGGPVGETFGLRLNGVWWDNQGEYRELARGQHVGGGDGWGLALVGKWEPSETVDARLRLEYSDDHYDPSATVALRRNFEVSPPASGFTPQGGAAACNDTPMGPVVNCVYAPTTINIGFAGAVPDASGLAPGYSEYPFGTGTWPGSNRELARASLTLNWQAGPGTLTSITGLTDASYDFLEDGDFDALLSGPPGNATDTALRAAMFDFANETRQFSQRELRFQSDLDGPLNFALDALYWKDDVEQVGQSVTLFCFPAGTFGPMAPATCGPRSANQQLALVQRNAGRVDGHDVEHRSVAAQFEWRASERLLLSAEARYAKEKELTTGQNCDYAAYGAQCIDPTFPGFAIFGPPITFLGDPTRQATSTTVQIRSNSSATTPRFSAQYRVNPDLLFYASAAKGIKPGGVSTVSSGAWTDVDYDGDYDEITYGAEKLWAYEIGAKADWLDGRLRINVALYWQDYEGKQTGAQNITPSGIATGRILNAGTAEIKGAELSAVIRPSDNWLFSLNYAYTDGEYTDFVFTSTSSGDAVRAGSCNVVGQASQAGIRYLCQHDLAGRKVEDVPEHALVALGRYEGGFGGNGRLRWYVEADSEIQGERYIDVFNRRWVDDYAVFNLRVGLVAERWEALLYADNVGDDDTIRSAQDAPGDIDASLRGPTNFSPADNVTVRLPDPRIVGLRFRVRF